MIAAEMIKGLKDSEISFRQEFDSVAESIPDRTGMRDLLGNACE